jgi:hypothetical protein
MTAPRRRWSYSFFVYALAPAFIALAMLADGAGFRTNPHAAFLWAMCLLALQAVIIARWMQLKDRRMDDGGDRS